MSHGRPLIVTLAMTVSVLVGFSAAGSQSAFASAPSPSSLVSVPSALVNPLAGTGAAPIAPGNVGEFPGADVPFGMMQWSPDTTPDRTDGSGYSHADSRISGFSLTHMSGTGCASYGDIPVLPTVGEIGDAPENASARFSHADERASPGRYRVVLGPSKLTTELTVTTRTGLSRFTFPSTARANVLFKVSGSANGVSASGVHVIGNNEISGQVTSGQFCDTERTTRCTLRLASTARSPRWGRGTARSSDRGAEAAPDLPVVHSRPSTRPVIGSCS